jgi:hypothetical protein
LFEEDRKKKLYMAIAESAFNLASLLFQLLAYHFGRLAFTETTMERLTTLLRRLHSEPSIQHLYLFFISPELKNVKTGCQILFQLFSLGFTLHKFFSNSETKVNSMFTYMVYLYSVISLIYAGILLYKTWKSFFTSPVQ